MIITVQRDLNIVDLYDELVGGLLCYGALEDANLTAVDMSSGIYARIFTALADEAAKRDKEGK